MVLDEMEIAEVVVTEKSWLVFLEDNGMARHFGSRVLPTPA